MVKVILYLRVSTDEQAFGFSLIDQAKRLTEYCIKNNLEIAETFQDDFSGKTFERPGFKKLLATLAQNGTKGAFRGKNGGVLPINQVLFTKWSRFSRNTTDSYNMIRQLNGMGIQVQAIDEPVDFSIAQNKAMLALYLVMPEIDNDMRSDNTRRGMRRAMKEGRYVSTAPQGYLNARDERGKPILIIDEEKAPLIKEMFELMADSKLPQQQIRKAMFRKGLKYCRTKFKTALTNPIYIGKIRIAAYKGEPEEIVNGIHPPIIDETTFYRVQENVAGRPRKRPTRVNSDLPLRGFLYCQQDHRLTGSCSHGHGGLYHYYHCPNVNCERHRADQVNESYVQFLERIKMDKDSVEMYMDYAMETLKPDPSKQSQLSQQIKAQEQRIQVLQDKYIDGNITVADFQQIKTRYESQLFELKAQLSVIIQSYTDFNLNFGQGLNLLSNLPEYYQNANTELKREIIGSITPGKLYFENKKVRTSEINQAIRLIATLDKGFSESQILRKVEYEPNVLSGSPQSTELRTFQTDLQLLSNLFKRVA